MLLYINNLMVNTDNIAHAERLVAGDHIHGSLLKDDEVALTITFTAVVENPDSGKVDADEWYFYGRDADDMYDMLRGQGKGWFSNAT